ncbi:MAG: purine-nucleoside phosphorylase [Chloroflexi bacterium]|nr:purine-nucleoside phosphorylase [Chloroflexota bacterium]
MTTITKSGPFDSAVSAIRARTKLQPVAAIVLGSGLGALADEVGDAVRIPFADIPGWKRSTVPGHAGELVVGTLSGKPVAVMKGRLHFYEGYDIADVAYPMRVFKAWGIDTVILTNACGGLNPKYKAGDLMVISDHINFMAANPLHGPNDEALGPRLSTVPEVLVARHSGMRILAISTVTDMATGIPGQIEHVSHEEVLAVANRAGKRLAEVVKGVVARL